MGLIYIFVNSQISQKYCSLFSPQCKTYGVHISHVKNMRPIVSLNIYFFGNINKLTFIDYFQCVRYFLNVFSALGNTYNNSMKQTVLLNPISLLKKKNPEAQRPLP